MRVKMFSLLSAQSFGLGTPWFAYNKLSLASLRCHNISFQKTYNFVMFAEKTAMADSWPILGEIYPNEFVSAALITRTVLVVPE
jgi:hypothetical protein